MIETAEWYDLSKDRAAAMVAEIAREVRYWRKAAQSAGIARADIELTAAAFAHAEISQRR